MCYVTHLGWESYCACFVSGLAPCPIARVLSVRTALIHPTAEQQSGGWQRRSTSSGATLCASPTDRHPFDRNHRNPTPRQAFHLFLFHSKSFQTGPLLSSLEYTPKWICCCHDGSRWCRRGAVYKFRSESFVKSSRCSHTKNKCFVWNWNKFGCITSEVGYLHPAFSL